MANVAPQNPRENRLAAETSPYLLQHKTNPVDWWPWGPAALSGGQADAVEPIFLSIGYSACHWCHVMAHESFENAGDRRGDERAFRQHQGRSRGAAGHRPDLHERRATADGERGGWPMSMFLTPDLEPFYGGTYWPHSADGMPGFDQVLRWSHAWRESRQRSYRTGVAVDRVDGLRESLSAATT